MARRNTNLFSALESDDDDDAASLTHALSNTQIVDSAEDGAPAAAAWRELGQRVGAVPPSESAAAPPPATGERRPSAATGEQRRPPSAATGEQRRPPSRPTATSGAAAASGGGASTGGDYSAGMTAGRDALRKSFQRGLSHELQLEAATQAKAFFAAVWTTAKERKDSFGTLMTARIAALTGECMVRMAYLSTMLEDYSPSVAGTYDSAITLLTSARTDADELLALQVAGALRASSLVNPDDLSSEVAQSVQLVVQQACALKANLERVIARMDSEVTRMREARDAVRERLGPAKWKAGSASGGQSQRSVEMRQLVVQLGGARELYTAIMAFDHRLQALQAPSGAGGDGY